MKIHSNLPEEEITKFLTLEYCETLQTNYQINPSNTNFTMEFFQLEGHAWKSLSTKLLPRFLFFSNDTLKEGQMLKTCEIGIDLFPSSSLSVLPNFTYFMAKLLIFWKLQNRWNLPLFAKVIFPKKMDRNETFKKSKLGTCVCTYLFG